MFPVTYTLLPLTVSMRRVLGSDDQAFIKAMVIRYVDLLDDVLTGRVQPQQKVEKWHTHTADAPLCYGKRPLSAPVTISATKEW